MFVTTCFIRSSKGLESILSRREGHLNCSLVVCSIFIVCLLVFNRGTFKRRLVHTDSVKTNVRAAK